MSSELSRPLYEAVWRGKLDQVLDLLSQGANAQEVFANNRTLVHVAAWFNHPAVVAPLVEKGAPMNEEDRTGATPLMLAIQNGSFTSFKALCFLKAPLSALNSQGTTALHQLAKSNRLEWLEWLAKQPTQPNWNVQDGQGSTLSHVAVLGKHWKMISLFNQKGVDQDQPNHQGETTAQLLKGIPGGLKWVRSSPNPSPPQAK